MREFRGKKMMGHVFRRWGFKIKVKRKRIGKKNMQVSGLLFFLSILEAGASAFAAVRIGSISIKNLRKKLSIRHIILEFTLVHNLEALTKSPLLTKAG